MKEDVVKTGIADFDNFFAGGGFPRGNSILVLGGPGSGKSIFGLQYLYKGAVDYKEPGIFLTLEEPPSKIRRNALVNFGWNFKKLEEEKKLLIIDAVTARVKSVDMDSEVMRRGLDVDNMLLNIESAIKELGAKRLVIDSLSVMGLYSENKFDVRTKLIRLAGALSELEVTTLVISEAKTAGEGATEFPVETFMFDGVVTLHLDTTSQERRIAIRKMRGMKHVLGSYKFDITNTGIVVIP